MSRQNGTGVHVHMYFVDGYSQFGNLEGTVVEYFRPHSTRAFMEYQGRRYRDVCRSLALADDPVKGFWQWTRHHGVVMVLCL